jgi:hypothetical protein
VSEGFSDISSPVIAQRLPMFLASGGIRTTRRMFFSKKLALDLCTDRRRFTRIPIACTRGFALARDPLYGLGKLAGLISAADDFVNEPKRSPILGHRSLARKFAPADDSVDQPVIDGLRRVEDVVPVDVTLDLFEPLAG